jgi:hypothetical protein
MGLFDKRIAYKPFEYPEYYTEGWLKQAQAFWLHTEISMQGDLKDWNERLTKRKSTSSETFYLGSLRQNAPCPTIGLRRLLDGFRNTRSSKWQ